MITDNFKKTDDSKQMIDDREENTDGIL